MRTIPNPWKFSILALIAVVVIVATSFLDPVPQDPQYHQFADQRSYLSIPNTLNVTSNLLFALVGIGGLYLLCIRRSLIATEQILPAYITFFVALLVVAPGSAYYHWMPDNQSLVWDRLPMTLAFMSFFSIILAERISCRFARATFLPLLVAGISSILYWSFSEQAGSGDLRPYGLVQFLPILMIPLILLMFRPRFTRDWDLWIIIAFYLLAKEFETFDEQFFGELTIISGHSLKHVAASIGGFIYIRYLQRRIAL